MSNLLKTQRIGLTKLFGLALMGSLLAAFFVERTSPAENSQRSFATPQAAVNALVEALTSPDPQTAIVGVFGPEGETIVSSGDSVGDQKARKRFLSAYHTMHRLAYAENGRVVLYVGADNWPLPIPLVRTDGQLWKFDAAAGREELIYRRIGANELYTIDVLQNLVQAQNEYAARMRNRAGVPEYAQKIISDQGQYNGLYWPAAAGMPDSPIGALIANAVAEGYHTGKGSHPVPFHGYMYRVLLGQGENASGGASRYIRNGRMTGGFAFLAYPAQYRLSGVMTFLVNQTDQVLQKDLGPDTSNLARKIELYNPDSTWKDTGSETGETQETTPAGHANISRRVFAVSASVTPGPRE